MFPIFSLQVEVSSEDNKEPQTNWMKLKQTDETSLELWLALE